MNQTSDRVRWTIADLDLLPDNGNRHEIIDGELFVTKALPWQHQKTCNRIAHELVSLVSYDQSRGGSFQSKCDLFRR